MTAKAITHRIAKLRTAVNEEVDPKATPLGKPIIKHRKVNGVGEKRPVPKEEVKVKAVVDDGYVSLLILPISTFSIDETSLQIGARERNKRDDCGVE